MASIKTSRKKIILVYPKMGMSGAMVQHMPLSIIYAAIEPIKAGFTVDLVDVRLNPDTWQRDIAAKITPDTILLGMSVLTGTPIINALEITRWAKKNFPDIKIVWGGPHAAFNGREIMDEPTVDFVVTGYGSMPLALLARWVASQEDAPALGQIEGLLYRDNGQTIAVPPHNEFEFTDYKEIPYHLIEKDLDRYGQLDNKERIFPMFSVMGCPYQCTFCSSPAQYKDMKKKYVPYTTRDVVDHIEYVIKKYGATYIYFIDDDSFVNLSRVEEIIDEIKHRKIVIRLGFRGARISEIIKMSDAYLDKLAAAGTNILHIGAESGSQKILDLIKKDCTVDDIISVNKNLARHPQIKTAYNWIVGVPGETVEDLKKTRDLIRRLIKDNPNAIIFIPNKFRPLPGTKLYQLALDYGYARPRKLEDWAETEAEGNYRPPWYTDEQAKMIKMMQVTSYFIDHKIEKVDIGNSLRFKVVRVLAWLYSPLATLRFRYGITGLLIEYRIFHWFSAAFRL